MKILDGEAFAAAFAAMAYATIIGLAMYFAVGVQEARGDDLILEAGANYSIYSDEAKPALSYTGRVGWKQVYLWGGYEDIQVKMLGQPLGDTTVLAGGLGARHSFTDKFTVYGEVGYGTTDLSVNDHIEGEVVYTKIVGNHRVHGRKVPVSGPFYPPYGYESSYEVEGGPVWRIGVTYELLPHVKLNLSYKALKGKEEYAIWDEERRNAGRGYWREDSTHDFSAFEGGIVFSW